MQVEQLNLVELKERVKVLGCTRIQRDARDAPIVFLTGWRGFSTESRSGFSHVAVWFRLDGNRVTVNKMGEPDSYYFVS